MAPIAAFNGQQLDRSRRRPDQRRRRCAGEERFRARQGRHSGPTTEERERLKQLARENRGVRQTIEIRRKVGACFSQAEFARRLQR